MTDMSENTVNLERLAEIKARVEAATPGPWVVVPGCGAFIGRTLIISRDEEAKYLGAVWAPYVEPRPFDAEFIAHSREDVEFLLSVLSGTGEAECPYHEEWPDDPNCDPHKTNYHEVDVLEHDGRGEEVWVKETVEDEYCSRCGRLLKPEDPQ